MSRSPTRRHHIPLDPIPDPSPIFLQSLAAIRMYDAVVASMHRAGIADPRKMLIPRSSLYHQTPAAYIATIRSGTD